METFRPSSRFASAPSSRLSSAPPHPTLRPPSLWSPTAPARPAAQAAPPTQMRATLLTGAVETMDCPGRCSSCLNPTSPPPPPMSSSSLRMTRWLSSPTPVSPWSQHPPDPPSTDEEKLEFIQGRLNQLLARVESIDTTQQHLMARTEILAKEVEQRAKYQQLMAKQMEATAQAVARLTAASTTSTASASAPALGFGAVTSSARLGSNTSAPLLSTTTAPSPATIVSAPSICFMLSSASATKALVAGAAPEVFDSMPLKDVAWDEDTPDERDSHHSTLQQLVQCEKFGSDKKVPKVESKESVKQMRIWDDAPTNNKKLDFTDSTEDGEENAGTDQRKKGWFYAIFQSIAGNSGLEKSNLQSALKALKNWLKAKNVAEEIAERLCESVAGLHPILLRIVYPKRPWDPGVQQFNLETAFHLMSSHCGAWGCSSFLLVDVVDLGWSTLADLSAHEGKFLGCSNNQSCVGIWIVDFMQVGPFVVSNFEAHWNGRSIQADSSVSSALGRLSVFRSLKTFHIEFTATHYLRSSSMGQLHGTTNVFALSGTWVHESENVTLNTHTFDFLCDQEGENYVGFVLLMESVLDDEVAPHLLRPLLCGEFNNDLSMAGNGSFQLLPTAAAASHARAIVIIMLEELELALEKTNDMVRLGFVPLEANCSFMIDRLRKKWMIWPCLYHQKGCLVGASFNGKIYAIDGGDGIETYSEIQTFDSFLGKWVCSPSMMHSQFALAAAGLSGFKQWDPGIKLATTLTSWHLLVTFCSLHIAVWMKLFEQEWGEGSTLQGKYERQIRQAMIYFIVFLTVFFYLNPITAISALTTLKKLPGLKVVGTTCSVVSDDATWNATGSRSMLVTRLKKELVISGRH